ncbi:hypothetical protein F4782DRAFT_39109 [Xylaria castorea]|nr:hypothetical protein F4782DRAFT_39109 [Xylaria castorea]
MVSSDVESLLNNGYWPNSRAKSPDPRSISDTSHKPSYLSQDDQAIPRRLPYHIGSQKPPHPIVEDENDALAKEAGLLAVSSVASEEPTNRGDPDQYPILLPVDEHQHNPERRFILVPNESDLSSDVSDTENKSGGYRRTTERTAELDTEPPFYEANTCRKYESPPGHDNKTSKKEIRPETKHRRSHPGDLPPIITDGGSGGRSDDNRREKSTTRTDNRSEDYLSARPSASSRVPREHLLTPEVIEHATNGRDRQYYRGGSSPEPQSRNRSAQPSDQYNRNSQHDRKYKERESKSAHPSSPTLQKRRTSEVPKYTRRGSKENYESSRQYIDRSSSKSDRKVPSSTHSQSDRDSGSQQSSSSRDARAPPQYSDTFYSSEDDSRQRVDSRRIRSGMPAGKHELPPTPVESRGTARRKSREQSSLPSPRLSQSSLSDPYSSSSSSRSATFPREPVPSRSENRAGRPLPRASTSKGSFSAARNAVPTAVSVTTAIPSAPIPNASVDHRRSPVRPAPKAGSTIDSRAQPSTPSVSIPTRPSWPPPRFEPPPSSKSSSSPIGSYRRYSTEVKTGDLPDIPHCPRTREEAGHMDWLTLPRCDSFNICPSCYSANFASTEFAHEFVLMPFRPRDRPLACDFGASEFYRIAWLFTRKYGRPDLGLFHGLTKIAATCQPCTGHRQVSRIWYSIRDPSTKRYIDEFTVCDACASTVETLLPSLTGLFVPLDSPAERTRGVCAMHHDRGYDRGRFLLYFDVLEGAADHALQTQSAPNVQALADRIRQLAAIPPCPEGRTLYDAYWHTMREVPIVVCPECFMMVVQPLLDGRGDLTVAGNFHNRLQYEKKAECMLFSDRMRSVFNRAVMKRDLGYLTEKVNERTSKKEEFDARLKALQRQGTVTPWAAAETDRIIKEWKRYE